MSTLRKLKKGRKGAKDRLAEIRVEFKATLRLLGIDGHFNRLPAEVRQRIYLGPYGPPAVVFVGKAEGDPDRKTIEKLILEGLRSRTVPSKTLGISFPIRAVYYPLRTLAAGSQYFSPMFPDNSDLAEIRRVSTLAFDETDSEVDNEATSQVLDVLVRHMRFDQKMFYHQLLNAPQKDGSRRVEVRIFLEERRRTTVVLDGEPRPAFQCGLDDCNGRTDWVAWNPADPEASPGEDALPVYVQSHAIERMHERVGRDFHVNYLMYSMFMSLRKPRVRWRTREEFYVDYNFGGHRFGYLPVTRVGGLFVVRTFLFLTMAKTPEGKQIREKLARSRHALEITRLDSASTFFLSDIRQDAELVEVLTDCGCGHLFEIAEIMDKGRERELIPQAANIRRVLSGSSSDTLPLVAKAPANDGYSMWDTW